MEPKPNLFIVGAPRCGTSAMHEYLAEHEQVFMPWVKEPHFFCTDLNEERDRFSGSSRMFWPIQGEEQYLFLFREAKGERVIGESSVLYLYSRTAAREIARFNPDARILIMLREPVAFLYSLHAVFVYLGDETCLSFVDALELEDRRRAGNDLPPTARMPSLLMYSQFARFTEQIKRYQEHFPPEQIKVVIFDDLKRDTAQVYGDTLDFLGVEKNELPRELLRPRNPNKAPRSAFLSRMVRPFHPHVVKLIKDKGFPKDPSFRPHFLTRALPESVCMGLHRVLERINRKVVPRPPLGDGERHAIAKRFAGEVGELSELLGRDLVSLWGYDPH